MIQVTVNGQLELPPEISSQLQPGDEFLLWQEEDTIILKRVEKSTVEEMIKAKKGVNSEPDSHFFENSVSRLYIVSQMFAYTGYSEFLP